MQNVVNVQAKGWGLKVEAVTSPDYTYTFRSDRKLKQSDLTYDQIRAIGHLEITTRLSEMLREEERNLPYDAFMCSVRETLEQSDDEAIEPSVINLIAACAELGKAHGEGKEQKVKRMCEIIAAHALQIRNKTIGIKRVNLSGGGQGKMAVV